MSATQIWQGTLPYADAETGATSGHSGSETSKEHAHALDASGASANYQAGALRFLRGMRYSGATAREVGDALWLEHQSYSRVMSNLHKSGVIVRLTERRKGAEVYVLPEFAGDRPVSPYRPNAAARKIAALLELVDYAEADGATAIYVTALRKALS